MRRLVPWLACLASGACATPRAPTPPPPACVAVPANPPPPAPARSAPPAPPPASPRTFRETVADLVREARAGRDRDLAPHVDLLEAIDRLSPEASERTTITRDEAREREATAAHGHGTALACVASFVEPGGDAAALRRVFLDFDRNAEFTGKPGTRLLARTGSVSIGETDATRRVLWLTFSARWRFEARELDRGAARVFVSAATPWDGAQHVLESRGVFVAVPEAGGVRVAHSTLSVVDFEVPGIARGAAVSMAEREVRERVDALRGHWREYVR